MKDKEKRVFFLQKSNYIFIWSGCSSAINFISKIFFIKSVSSELLLMVIFTDLLLYIVHLRASTFQKEWKGEEKVSISCSRRLSAMYTNFIDRVPSLAFSLHEDSISQRYGLRLSTLRK